MRPLCMKSACLLLAPLLSGCGVGTTHIPEVWDSAVDYEASYHMESQVKFAVLCALKKAVYDVRALDAPELRYHGRVIRSKDQFWLPDTWGVLVQLSLQAAEKSKLTPGIISKDPVNSAITGFSNGPATAAQSFSVGVGGELSSENTRYDKFNFFYSVSDLASPYVKGNVCSPFMSRIYLNKHYLGDNPSTSSPFVDAAGLGISEWLTSAVRVIQFIPSTNKLKDDSGPPLGATSGNTASDTATYSNKFVIISDANVTPSWSLFRIGTPTTPLYDASRTRTHELIMTVGPGATEKGKDVTGQPKQTFVPSQAAVGAQLASQIGSAVANAIRSTP